MFKSISWTGKKGNKIELKAYCKITMANNTIDLDGHIITMGQEPLTDANLELWVDGKKVDSCWDINFWVMIDIAGHPEFKKVWGLDLAVNLEQAEKVTAFFESVINEGKAAEVKLHEKSESDKEAARLAKGAERVIAEAEHTVKNNDGTLMTNEQAKVWARRYNDLHNEGGEGYISEVITKEDYEWAKSILGR
jgi:hypothetical protein